MFVFEHPERTIIVAVAMMLFGCVMPFLMALKVVESTLFMNFLSFGMSTLGLFIGVAAVAMLRVREKAKKDEEDKYR